MIKHDYAAKHDYHSRRPSRLKRFWQFMTYRDPAVGESPLESIAAGIACVLAIVMVCVLVVMVGA